MALGRKINKRNVMVKVNGTYQDWLVMIGSETPLLYLCVFVG